MSSQVDFSALRPRSFGEWFVHWAMLAVVILGLSATLVAIVWQMLAVFQLVVTGGA